MAILKREQGAKNLQANIGYADSVEVVNDFDSRHPWNGIYKYADEAGNYWVRIPKFYTNYVLDENNHIKQRYISEYKVGDDWNVNPIFLNEDGQELPYIEIAAYLITLENNVPTSKPGGYPTTGQRLNDMRTLVDNLNTEEGEYKYGLFNIWASMLEQDLFTIEYANTYVPSVMSGYNYSAYNGRGMSKAGTTDDNPHHTGMISAAANNNGSAPMKYRHIENMIGNGHLVLDGIKLSGNNVYVDGQVTTIPRIKTTGYIEKLQFDPTTRLVFPAVVTDQGSYLDYFSGNESDNQIIVRGTNLNEGYGLFCYSCFSENGRDNYGTYRMIRQPK